MTERPSSAYVEKIRNKIKSVPNQIILDRKLVLEGGFFINSDDNVHPSQWESPSFRLDVFLSSTFTDTTIERNYLMDELQFELRKIGREYGLSLIHI